jgi:hypothetical protein
MIKFGCIFDRQYLLETLEFNLANSVIINLVEKYSHNLISDGFLNISDTTNILTIYKFKEKIAQTIQHHFNKVKNSLNLNVDNILEFNKNHQQTKFNPLKNNNLTANLVSVDNLAFNDLQSLLSGYVTIDQQDRLLDEINKELKMMCRFSFNLNEIGKTTDSYNLDLGLFINNNLGNDIYIGNLDNNDDETIKVAFMNKFNLGLINSNIAEYLNLVNKGANTVTIESFNSELYKYHGVNLY